MSEIYETRWLFKILDYEHWDILYLGKPVFQLVLNSADQSVAMVMYDENSNPIDLPHTYGYKAWRSWVRDHERPWES